MKTEIIKEDLSRAAEMIRSGGLVAVPTETVYGLACNGLDREAVDRVYEVKGRPAVKPLSLMVSGAEMMDKFCVEVPKAAKTLAEKFWPGPLTIVLRSAPIVPEIVRAGGDTVGLRCPDHPLTLEALRLAGVPFAAPSANPSGEASPKNAEKVLEYFEGKIEAVIDGGRCGIGTESTIIDMSRTPYRILRQGALPEKTVADALSGALTVIGITGGSGSGKTTALKVLEEMGALIIDCDKVYHELLESSAELISELDSCFSGVVNDGVLDRKALGKKVFNDEKSLAQLNSISHRYVSGLVDEMLRVWAMQGGTLAAVDAIELISSGLAVRCKAVFAVLSDTETRLKRIMDRDGISKEYALMRIKAQHSDEYFIENCGYILYNNCSKEEFENQCRKYFLEVI